VPPPKKQALLRLLTALVKSGVELGDREGLLAAAGALELDEVVEGLNRIGILEDLRLEIPGYALPYIRKPGDRQWHETDLMAMSYGYASQISPIYTLAFYNAIANNGKLVRPMFTRKIMKNGDVVQKFSTEVVRESICSENTLRTIRNMLIGVVDSGTGRNARSKVIKIAGKTGTARLVEGGSYTGGHQVSFAGYFPADNPMYSCIAVIRKPGQAFPPSGGQMAGVVMKEIAERVYAHRMHFDIRKVVPDSAIVAAPTPKAGEFAATRQVLRKLNIKTDKSNVQASWVAASATGRTVTLTDRKTPLPGLVPDVVGMGAKDAVYLLERAGLKVRLTGMGRIYEQSIPAGKKAVRGQTIVVSLK
jgi:cell division protein FtsI (penicillin-binding protein 3)